MSLRSPTISVRSFDRNSNESLEDLPPTSRWQRYRKGFLNSLNFYRVHMLAFIFIPLILSAIFYASNGSVHISYIDCLFINVSAMTVTGLATVNLSTLTPWQQVIMFLQMIMGSTSFVSIVMILVRQHFFRAEFQHIIEARQRERQRRGSINIAAPVRAVKRRLSQSIERVRGFSDSSAPIDENAIADDESVQHDAEKKKSSLSWLKLPKSGRKNTPEKHDNPSGSERSSTPSPAFAEKQLNKPQYPEEHRQNSRPHTPDTPVKQPKPHKHKPGKNKFSVDMIKRVEGGGVGLMNPMGRYEAYTGTAPSSLFPGNNTPTDIPEALEVPRKASVSSGGILETASGGNLEAPMRSASHDEPEDDRGIFGNGVRPDSPGEISNVAVNDFAPDGRKMSDPGLKVPYARREAVGDDVFPRTKTIAFDDPRDNQLHLNRGITSQREGGSYMPRTGTMRSAGGETTRRIPRTTTGASSFPRTATMKTVVTRADPKLTGYGGFPTPIKLLRDLFTKCFPQTSQSLSKTLTMPRTNTLSGKSTVSSIGKKGIGGALAAMGAEASGPGTGKEVPYISFEAVVGRNSNFKDLTEDQLDELGGVEYRALKVLLWIVVGYFITVQMICFVVIAPYISSKTTWDPVFAEQPKNVSIPWFSLFQAVSAFTNTGMSLVDKSMVPFQTAYPMIVFLIIAILAGNTSLPILLRFVIWTLFKFVPTTSRIKETLKFLLDHPRRCYTYLFPSTQTWFLALVVFSLTMIDWVSFLVLDLGTPEIEELPVGTRLIAGLFQSAAVRAAGFGIVPLAALAPAVKVLYVVMMYISVYPIALSVRSTNVYEEKSLGLFEDFDDEEEDTTGEGPQAVAKYLGWHARRQLAFDIWWMGFALWLICIIERSRIVDPTNESWFNIFNIIFELVSAYGTVGLSLGVAYDNFSFAGAFRPLSKLVLVAVMIRGRHRGLPVAIDRAVMLPKDFTIAEETAFDDERSRRLSRRSSRPTSFFDQTDEYGLDLGRRRSNSHVRGPSFTASEVGKSSIYSGSAEPSRVPPSSPRSASRRFSNDVPPSAAAHSGFPGSGALTPVRESAMSRAPTRNEEVDPLGHQIV